MTVAITPCNSFIGSHRTHRISSRLSPEDITNALGVESIGGGDKTTIEWQFYVNGFPCAIWDYKGSRWSAYDPHNVMHLVFGADIEEG